MSLAENKQKVESFLAPYRTSPILNHIGGEAHAVAVRKDLREHLAD